MAQLRSLAERSAFARWILVRALLCCRRDTAGARQVLEGCPPEQREAPSVAAAKTLIEPSPAVRLHRLHELRARWGPWRVLLTLEIGAAHCVGDLGALEEAYLQRCALLGRRPWPRLVRAWARAPHLGWLAAAAFGVGFALGSPWIFLTALALFGAWNRLQAHLLGLSCIRCVLLPVAAYGLVAAAYGKEHVLAGAIVAIASLGIFLWLTWDLHRTRSREREAARTGEVPAGSDA